MLNDSYRLLGASASDSDEVIREKYEVLKEKYLEDRFKEGEVGNRAAKMLTDIKNAYDEIMSARRDSGYSFNAFSEVERLIRNSDLVGAQTALDAFDERGGEWHYWQSVIFYKKNWLNESKKQLEIACNMEPNNEKFKNAYNKVVNNINAASNGSNGWNTSGNGANGQGGQNDNVNGPTQQLGGGSCAEWCCEMIACNALLNCCCNCR